MNGISPLKPATKRKFLNAASDAERSFLTETIGNVPIAPKGPLKRPKAAGLQTDGGRP